ncbi:DNA alkylation repair protein [Leptospira sp. GIMC2001]|uniref:DNA alkylation repair protein n=1 Tax=Leptospira sp. GIMC2001 TaxID=1513297 RepID=UPI00234BF531|nr:DNA alkylation repair protein [Leptospira sp. GIMC2001]WCL49781.1 DNA alkylation repair protein [Leptospira sp. GIMC2001]
MKKILNKQFEELELKDRMKHIAIVLKEYLSPDFASATEQIIDMIDFLREREQDESEFGFGYLFLPEYIYLYGLEYFDQSIWAMERITQFTSCEFAVRPFLIRYESKMLAVMLQWSKHKNESVRRLASEGSRPRLPWGIALQEFKKNPNKIIPILENLKEDPSETVRRSVANNLNDISKDNPDVMISLINKWKGKSDTTDRLIKHASRTLLKQGHPSILKIYNLNNKSIKMGEFRIFSKSIKIGSSLEFRFNLENISSKPKLIRLEYGIYFLLKNGSLSRKVFKISEKTVEPYEKSQWVKKHSFRIITTKQFYPGRQSLSIIVNGEEVNRQDFYLEL